ncbi:MAG: chemotaxis protein CheA [Anaerolineaceae bacterium]|nr:chemotaxis protein CheA [Anaerolineaceae bacterium]
MALQFDISEDELPVFLAESEEQLQMLDEGLIELERVGENEELVQKLFRAAHTLKGMAGMIGHKRMVSVTHAMETALDGLRKGKYGASTELVDSSLVAVDGLRLLFNEVIDNEESDVDMDQILDGFVLFGSEETVISGSTKKQEPKLKKVNMTADAELYKKNGTYTFEVIVHISKNSIASAARAFQVVLALQESCEIITLTPDMSEIETAKPVYLLVAMVKSNENATILREKIELIDELDTVQIIDQNEPSSKKSDDKQKSKMVEKSQDKVVQNVSSDERLTNVPAKVHIEKTVRTSVERLDRLMNLVGELITDRNRLYQLRSIFEQVDVGQNKAEGLSETISHVGRITDQLQKEVMSIRMLPVSNVFHKFPRMVRDLAVKFNKKVDLIIEGEETELDRSVIEEISDPLIHLIRNSLDHGIEPVDIRKQVGKPEIGKVYLTAKHEQGRILLSVEDDGNGIDPNKIKASALKKGLISQNEHDTMSDDEAINLIFASGLSTAKKVSDVSGRGVGMDIVRTNIQKLSGSIQVETKAGKGSKFEIMLPLTLAIVPTLLVQVEEQVFAIPLVSVMETKKITKSEIKTVNNSPVFVLRDRVLPVVDLTKVFNIDKKGQNSEEWYVVVVVSGRMQIGLLVDSLLGQEEVVVKSLGPLFGEVHGVASAAILGDGKVILIMDVQDVMKLSAVSNEVVRS